MLSNSSICKIRNLCTALSLGLRLRRVDAVFVLHCISSQVSSIESPRLKSAQSQKVARAAELSWTARLSLVAQLAINKPHNARKM